MQHLLDYDHKCYLYEITKDRKSVIGCLMLLDVAKTKIFEHENAEINKVKSYMQNLNATNVQKTPVTIAVKTKESHSLLKKLLLDIKATNVPLLVNENNGQTNSIWAIDKSLNSIVSQLLQQQQLYVIDGHHRYNAIKMNANLGGHSKMLAWIVTSDDCCFKAVHRVVKISNEQVKQELINKLNLKFTASEQLMDQALQPGNIGFYDGAKWSIIQDFSLTTAESLHKISALIKSAINVELRYEITQQQLQQAIDEQAMIFMLPELSFKEIEEQCNMNKVLPTFSTYMQYRPCEDILSYKYKVSRVNQAHQWLLEKVS